MTIDQYYYVYSAMAQSIAALIALAGVFTIFKIQTLRENRKTLYSNLRIPLKIIETGSEKIVDEKIRLTIEHKDNSEDNQKKYASIKDDHDNLERVKKEINDVLEKGKKIIVELTMLFLFYVVSLNLTSFLFHSFLRIPAFILGILASIFIFLKMKNFIITCLGKS